MDGFNINYWWSFNSKNELKMKENTHRAFFSSSFNGSDYHFMNCLINAIIIRIYKSHFVEHRYQNYARMTMSNLPNIWYTESGRGFKDCFWFVLVCRRDDMMGFNNWKKYQFYLKRFIREKYQLSNQKPQSSLNRYLTFQHCWSPSNTPRLFETLLNTATVKINLDQ